MLNPTCSSLHTIYQLLIELAESDEPVNEKASGAESDIIITDKRHCDEKPTHAVKEG